MRRMPSSAPPSALTPEQRRLLRRQCTLVAPGFLPLTLAEELRRMADWCEAGEVLHDMYGEGPLVQGFERKLADLLGKPAAVFLPSGVMAQLAAVRIWCEAAGLARFGLHPTAHQLHHEQEAHAALMHCQAVPLGDRLRPLLAIDLQASAQPLACVVVELPIREAGGQLPTWDELQALQTESRQRGIRLHMDGARLWECGPFYGMPYAEIAAGFDSVYVSVYKGIGALSGALLAGDAAFIDQARLWRRRLGGTLYHLGPYVASAAMRFDERIGLMPALFRRTLALAAALQKIPGLRVNPPQPQTPMFHLYFDAPADRVLAAAEALATQHQAWLIDGVGPAEVPGWSVTEFVVGDRLLALADERVVPLFEQLAALIAAAR